MARLTDLEIITNLKDGILLYGVDPDIPDTEASGKLSLADLKNFIRVPTVRIIASRSSETPVDDAVIFDLSDNNFYISRNNEWVVYATSSSSGTSQREIIVEERDATEEDYDLRHLHIIGQNLRIASRKLGADLSVTYIDYTPTVPDGTTYRGVVNHFYQYHNPQSGDIVYDKTGHRFYQWHSGGLGWQIPNPQPVEDIKSYATQVEADHHVTAVGDIVEFGNQLHFVSAYTPATQTTYDWDKFQDIKNLEAIVAEVQASLGAISETPPSQNLTPVSSEGQGFDETLIGGSTTMLAGTGTNFESIATEYDLTDDVLNYDFIYFVLQSRGRKVSLSYVTNRQFQALPITDLTAGDNLTRGNDNLEKGITVGYGRSDNTAGASNFTIHKINDRKLLIGTPGAHSTRGSYEVFACYGVNSLQGVPGGGAVRFDKAQELTSEQQSRAQMNIGGLFQLASTSQANAPQSVATGIELYAGTSTLANQTQEDIFAIPIPDDINLENFRVTVEITPQGAGAGAILFGWRTDTGHDTLLNQDGGVLDTDLREGEWKKTFILDQNHSFIATADNPDLGIVAGQRYITMLVAGRAQPNTIVPPLEGVYQIFELADNRVSFHGDYEVLRDFQVTLKALGNQNHVFDGGREIDLSLFKYLRFTMNFHQTNPTIVSSRIATADIIKYCFDSTRNAEDRAIYLRSNFITRQFDARIGQGNLVYEEDIFPVTTYGFNLNRVGQTFTITGFTTHFTSLESHHSPGRFSVTGET